MIEKHRHNRITWIKIESPKRDEIETLQREFRFHGGLIDSLLEKYNKPQVELYDNFIHIIQNVPIRTKYINKNVIQTKQINLLLAKDYVITVTDDEVQGVEKFLNFFENYSSNNKNSDNINHAGHVFYYLIKNIYTGILEDIKGIEDGLLNTKEMILEKTEENISLAIAQFVKELIQIKKILNENKGTIKHLSISCRAIFGREFEDYTSDLESEYTKIMLNIDNVREIISDISSVYNITLKEKECTYNKNISTIVTISLPIIVISQIFSLPAQNVPFVKGQYGFTIVIVIMLLFLAFLLFYPKQNKK